jgi:hypothetical protein
MASSTRLRIEGDIEKYLRLQAPRILDKSPDEVSGADLSTLANRIIYEHKLAHQAALRIPFAQLFNWLISLPLNGNKLPQAQEQPVLMSKPESYQFDAELADMFEDAA